MKIAILGCGKRLIDIYSKILLELKHDLFVWNRTSEKAAKFCLENKCQHIKTIEEIKTLKPDLLLCLASHKSHYELIKKIEGLVSCPILLETPAEDQKLLNCKMKLGCLEQWPQLPLEQFKELIFSKGIISRPYMVENDGRSADYHAIAQLRSYMGFSKPIVAAGFIKRFGNPGVQNTNGNINTSGHEWTCGHIEMSTGILRYNFSRTCKSLLSIPIQFLRSLSVDGCIVTGRMLEMGNDYEILDFRFVDKSSKALMIHKPIINRSSGITTSIGINEIIWENPYSNLQFDDQQTAIATIISNALKGVFYPYKEAFIDGRCVSLMRQSGNVQKYLKLEL